MSGFDNGFSPRGGFGSRIGFGSAQDATVVQGQAAMIVFPDYVLTVEEGQQIEVVVTAVVRFLDDGAPGIEGDQAAQIRGAVGHDSGRHEDARTVEDGDRVGAESVAECPGRLSDRSRGELLSAATSHDARLTALPAANRPLIRLLFDSMGADIFGEQGLILLVVLAGGLAFVIYSVVQVARVRRACRLVQGGCDRSA